VIMISLYWLILLSFLFCFFISVYFVLLFSSFLGYRVLIVSVRFGPSWR
jgi:hypothetical protein